ncbi:MAG: Ig-like domain-containing protein, partial [Oscillospiraceae bacterium]|nr:Ig-like domain-containing protein [Oscillospiraceae bacterium]
MSRIVCALLVVAMVCAMIPAALAAPVSGVTLNQNSLNLKPGDTATLVATVAPDDADDKTLTWESNDTNVVTVSNGAVTAVGAGSATITVTSAADNTKTATCAVTVAKASLTIENPNYTVPAVAIGTDLPQLPATMQAKGEGANAATCNIAWNEADVLTYNNNKNVAGTYVINGIASLNAEDDAKYTLTSNAVTATIVVGNTPVITIGQPVPQDMKIKKGATNKTLQVVATAAAGDKNLTSAITYQWYKS